MPLGAGSCPRKGSSTIYKTLSQADFWFGSFFHAEKLPAFVLLVGMVLTFVLFRVNTRLIRRGVTWWPGNIRRQGLHVHHIVFGLPFLFVTGLIEFTLRPPAPYVEILALFFGGAAACVFDEFALVLHLKDVYWEHEGRKSLTAVFLGISLTVFLVIGLVPLGIPHSETHMWLANWLALTIVVANVVAVIIALFKGKLWLGWVGFFVPVLAIVGALRLARPNSPWARWHYRTKPLRMARATYRAKAYDQKWGKLLSRVADFVAGAPGARKEEAPLAASTMDEPHLLAPRFGDSQMGVLEAAVATDDPFGSSPGARHAGVA